MIESMKGLVNVPKKGKNAVEEDYTGLERTKKGIENNRRAIMKWNSIFFFKYLLFQLRWADPLKK